MAKDKNKSLISSLEIALDILDRVEYTKIYEASMNVSGWKHKDYIKMLEDLAILLIKLKGIPDEDL